MWNSQLDGANQIGIPAQFVKASKGRHSDDMCASGLAIADDEQDIVPALLKHAQLLLDAADLPTPPEGYENWLDFAVDTMDTRAEEQDRQIAGTPVSRQSMRDAVHAELVALRRKAGEL